MTALDITTVRATVGDWLRGMTGDARPTWRLVSIDGEDPATGIGPVCHDEDHEANDSSAYECCPDPLIETESAPLAAYLVALLNADAEGGAA